MLDYLDKNKYLLGRIAFFIVFFWFGYLKIIGQSAAEGIVLDLFNALHMGAIISFNYFFYGLGIFEIIIAFGFLIEKFKKIILILFLIHMFTTFGPAIFDPKHFWNGTMVLTLEGQYIIKNLVFIIAGVYLLGRR